MSPIDTDTRLMRPTPETAADADTNIADWGQEPVYAALHSESRHIPAHKVAEVLARAADRKPAPLPAPPAVETQVLAVSRGVVAAPQPQQARREPWGFRERLQALKRRFRS